MTSLSVGHCWNSPEVHTPAQDSLISVSHERKRVSYSQSDEEPFLCQINLEINPLDSTLNTCSQTQEISFFSLQMLPRCVFLPLQILLDKIKLSEQFSETTNILSASNICIGFKRAEDL